MSEGGLEPARLGNCPLLAFFTMSPVVVLQAIIARRDGRCVVVHRAPRRGRVRFGASAPWHDECRPGHDALVCIRFVIGFIVLAAALSGCGSGSSAQPAASASSSTSTRPTPTTVLMCGPSEENCTSASVIATVTHLYEVGGGATAAEAACLAPITGRGTHAVNQAFDQVTAAQTARFDQVRRVRSSPPSDCDFAGELVR